MTTIQDVEKAANEMTRATNRLAKVAEGMGLLEPASRQEFIDEAVPNCIECGRKLWQDDCDLPEDDKFCSERCVEEHMNGLQELYIDEAND